MKHKHDVDSPLDRPVTPRQMLWGFGGFLGKIISGCVSIAIFVAFFMLLDGTLTDDTYENAFADPLKPGYTYDFKVYGDISDHVEDIVLFSGSQDCQLNNKTRVQLRVPGTITVKVTGECLEPPVSETKVSFIGRVFGTELPAIRWTWQLTGD